MHCLFKRKKTSSQLKLTSLRPHIPAPDWALPSLSLCKDTELVPSVPLIRTSDKALHLSGSQHSTVRSFLTSDFFPLFDWSLTPATIPFYTVDGDSQESSRLVFFQKVLFHLPPIYHPRLWASLSFWGQMFQFGGNSQFQRTCLQHSPFPLLLVTCLP